MFKDADSAIIKPQRTRPLFKKVAHKHNYPFDWRKGTHLIVTVNSWFIRTSALKDQLVAANKTINWYPKNVRDDLGNGWRIMLIGHSVEEDIGGRLAYLESVENDATNYEVIGSIKELVKKGKLLDKNIELHRPYVDEIILESDSGEKFRRVPDVLDVWFDSGAMPFAQWHYPFENKEVLGTKMPADFICEGIDQTRGWFYTCMR